MRRSRRRDGSPAGDTTGHAPPPGCPTFIATQPLGGAMRARPLPQTGAASERAAKCGFTTGARRAQVAPTGTPR